MPKRSRNCDPGQGNFFPFPETSTETEKSAVPPLIDTILGNSAASLAINISGGKDSQAMLAYLMGLYQQREWKAKVYALHADLGRMEWPQTPTFVRQMAEMYGVSLAVVKQDYDLIEQWEMRREKLDEDGKQHQPHWSSATIRNCTDRQKTAPCDKHMRDENNHLIVSAMGLRAGESDNRAGKDALRIRKSITTNRHKLKQYDDPYAAYDLWRINQEGRLALDWLPLHDWSEEQVWQSLGTSLAELQERRQLPDEMAIADWVAHPAYVLGKGNTRLSCALCVLGCLNDLINGGIHNPDLFEILADMEMKTGFSFQHKRSLTSLRDEIIIAKATLEATQRGYFERLPAERQQYWLEKVEESLDTAVYR